ncbi:MAG TPA: hypothetical protein VGP24_10990 [Glaciihabitans sp.]|jgi:hypothetical protein|nr:hypothetical protein [Glaciihabitans sp.]
MKGKILLVTGLGIGYVLGAKAGRERYESIKRITDKFWHSKGVQTQVHQVEEFVKDKAPDVAGAVADGARKVVDKVSGTRKPATARPAPRKTATPRSTTTKK